MVKSEMEVISVDKLRKFEISKEGKVCMSFLTSSRCFVCVMSIVLPIAIFNFFFILLPLRPKLYDVLGISHVLRNVINIVW